MTLGVTPRLEGSPRVTPPFLSIDPGSVHCGLAVFEEGDCTLAVEYSPIQLLAVVRWHLKRGLPLIVCEEWRLRAGKQLQGDPLRTVELIGVLRYLAGEHRAGFVAQPPSAKRPAAAIARREGFVLMSRGAGEHAKDAELHGIYYAYKERSR